jgi:peptidoglycan/LPS O-acetylase OafA/YrhL
MPRSIRPFGQFYETLVVTVFVWLVARASRGLWGVTGATLQFRPITYLGKISYGIYVYHVFVPYLLHAAFAGLGVGGFDSGWSHSAIAVALTVGVATISWFGFERPIIR